MLNSFLGGHELRSHSFKASSEEPETRILESAEISRANTVLSCPKYLHRKSYLMIIIRLSKLEEKDKILFYIVLNKNTSGIIILDIPVFQIRY